MKNWLRLFVQSRWFSLADVLIVLGSGAIWYFRPEYGWKILMIALLPWGMRILAGRAPFKFTPFDLPILIFLITAIIGARVAYDQGASWSKFWLVVGAVLFFYALAAQPRENMWLMIESIVIFGILVVFYTLLVYDWQANPVRVEIINQIGRAWMKVRPFDLQAHIQDEDIISNILLVLFPFPVLLFFHRDSDVRKNRWRVLFAGISTLIFLVGLSMAATREAVLFFLIGSIFGAWWWVNNRLEHSGFEYFRRIFWIFSGLALLFAFILLIRFPDGTLGLMQGSSVFSPFENRITVIDNTLHLTKDFPFIGGG